MISFATSQVFTGRSLTSQWGLAVPSVQLSAASAVVAAAGLTAPALAAAPPLTAALSPVAIPAVPALVPRKGVPSAASPSAAFPTMPGSVASDEPDTAGAVETPSLETLEFVTAHDGVRVGPTQARVSYDVAFNRIAENNAKVTGELERMHDLAREQGRGWYKASVTAAGAGMCVVAAAVVVLILGQLTTGIVTTVASVVPNVLASMFFANSRRADDRVDALTKRLTQYREAEALVDIAQTIEDQQLRDGVKAEIVRKMLAKP